MRTRTSILAIMHTTGKVSNISMYQFLATDRDWRRISSIFIQDFDAVNTWVKEVLLVDCPSDWNVRQRYICRTPCCPSQHNTWCCGWHVPKFYKVFAERSALAAVEAFLESIYWRAIQIWRFQRLLGGYTYTERDSLVRMCEHKMSPLLVR